MNARTETFSLARPRPLTRVADFVELTKPRITALVIMTTWVGFFVGAGDSSLLLMFHTLFGTALVCSGSSALNQVWEREQDQLMRRTRNRPLPAGRVAAGEAVLFGVVIAILGTIDLAVFVNPLSAFIAAFTLATYLFVYTPLKRKTWLATSVGAIPGALPPMIGWAAARGTLDAGAWSLFLIQFIWQLPHFYAIAWIYRDDYARGGFRMLPLVDAGGTRTGRQIAGWTALLLPVSLLPTWLGHAGVLYTIGALGMGSVFLALGLAWFARHSVERAKAVFLGSILYLPALLGCLVLDNLMDL